MKIKLITVGDEMQARFVQGMLQAHGVDSHLVTSNQSYSPGILGVSNGFVPYDIFVSDSDIEKAKEILQNNA